MNSRRFDGEGTVSAAPPGREDGDSRALRPWGGRLLGLLVAILCFEMGIFLIAFPWSHYWNSNFFSWLTPAWRELWVDPFFRGAVSGLGVVNLYVSLTEVFRLQAPSRASESAPGRLAPPASDR